MSELLGKETIDTNSYGRSDGMRGNFSTNFQVAGRELMTADEVRMLDNRYAIVFIRGERPIIDYKYDIHTNPNVYLGVDGGAEPYTHTIPALANVTTVEIVDIAKYPGKKMEDFPKAEEYFADLVAYDDEETESMCEYKTYSEKGQGRSAEKHYPTMTLDEISKLPIEQMADDDCVLFMWTTVPFLRDCFDVLEAWGFTYKTVAFVWVKQNRKSDGLFWGMGYWTRANAELCILATKGHPKRISASVHQVVLSHVEEHSKKPDETRESIVALLGDLPRIELFARQKTDGWD